MASRCAWVSTLTNYSSIDTVCPHYWKIINFLSNFGTNESQNFVCFYAGMCIETWAALTLACCTTCIVYSACFGLHKCMCTFFFVAVWSYNSNEQFTTSIAMSYLAGRLSSLIGRFGTARVTSSSLSIFSCGKNVSCAIHLRAINNCGKQQYWLQFMPNLSTYKTYRLGLPNQTSLFHTSPRRNIPPLLLVVLKPIAKAASIITGRWDMCKSG